MKGFYKIISIVVLFVFLCNSSVCFALNGENATIKTLYSWKEKIEPKLFDEMENSEKKIPVRLIDELKKNQEVYSVAVSVEDPFENWVVDTRYESLVSDNMDEEAIKTLIEKLKSEESEKVYQLYRASLLHYFDLNEDRVTFLTNTLIIASLTETEIEKVSDCKYVEKIDAISRYGDYVAYRYSSNDALKILKFTVGEIEALSWEYDINSDGKTNSSDALLALQSSVGNINTLWNLCDNSIIIENN